MSYFLRPLSGDGPITSPSQVDDSVVVGTVPPTRVDCSALPADSPWRRPGQACASTSTPVSEFLSSIFDNMFSSTPPANATTGAQPTSASSGPSLLLLAALGGVAYLMTRK